MDMGSDFKIIRVPYRRTRIKILPSKIGSVCFTITRIRKQFVKPKKKTTGHGTHVDTKKELKYSQYMLYLHAYCD
jgi:hypothetical protein